MSGFDESKHPRVPAGSPNGGQFTAGQSVEFNVPESANDVRRGSRQVGTIAKLQTQVNSRSGQMDALPADKVRVKFAGQSFVVPRVNVSALAPPSISVAPRLVHNPHAFSSRAAALKGVK